MCNCNKPSASRPRPVNQPTTTSSGTTQAFSLILRSGSKQSFGSRLEADAANARAGFTGIVRQNGA